MNAGEPRISVVIPVHNSRETIGKCLESLGRLDHPSFETIIVDDGSTDDTAEICESYGRVRVIRASKGGPSRARNIGIEAARGEFVAFTDGDCIVDPMWLTELEKGFVSSDVAGVGGDQQSPEDESDFGRMIQDFFKTIGFVTGYIKTHEHAIETEHNPSCNSIYRKSVLTETGGFDEALWPGEDVDLDRRITGAGYGLRYNPAAIVRHYRAQTYAAFASMMRRYGESQWPLVRRYGPFRMLHYEPIALVAGLGVAAWLILEDFGMSAPIIFLPLSVLFLAFLLKTGKPVKAIRFTRLMLITLESWNRGFFAAAWRDITRGGRGSSGPR
jgi:GT2 family glycosyltransferase